MRLIVTTARVIAAKRDEHRVSGCTGKAPLTWTRAKAIEKKMRRQDKGGLEAYRCKFCHQWHVGERA
jgi:hypothetical protein